ncbi:MAG: hypothetical protein NC217_01020 [Muribaculaceae bacterium]|nr:hypothetical protein [Muribaculaceae bacterium]
MRKILFSLLALSSLSAVSQSQTPDGQPIMRPLLEEFTGLWCSFCPRGYVAMETLKEDYPDNFIGLAYHNNDAMSNSAFKPFTPKEYPEIHVNRQNSATSFVDIYKIWPEEVAKVAPAWVEVKAEWGDEEHYIINATVTVSFTSDYNDVEYGISAVLVADGMSKSTWHQKNALVGQYDDPTMPGHWGELFTHGTNPMDDLVFNDVVLCSNDLQGDTESIPANIVAGEEYTYTTSFDLSHMGSLGVLGQSYRDNLRVVGLLLNRNPKSAINSNTSIPMGQLEGEEEDPGEDPGDDPGNDPGNDPGTDPGEDPGDDVYLNSLTQEATIILTSYYDMQGRKLSDNGNSKGIIIKKEFLSNGKILVSKLVR